MKKNLYRILGLTRNATPQQIKNAWRKKAMDLHPDRGGDAALFQEARLAFQILSDPLLRAHYDATGEIRAPEPDNHHAAIGGALYLAFVGAASAILNAGSQPSQRDMVAFMKEVLQKTCEEQRDNQKKMEKARAAVAKLEGRFNEKGDFLATMVLAELAKIDNQIKGFKQNIQTAEEALQYLEKCSFRWDPEIAFSPATSSATNASNVHTIFKIV